MIIREGQVFIFVDDMLIIGLFLSFSSLFSFFIFLFSLFDSLFNIRPLVKQLLQESFPVIWSLKFIKLLYDNRILIFFLS